MTSGFAPLCADKRDFIVRVISQALECMPGFVPLQVAHIDFVAQVRSDLLHPSVVVITLTVLTLGLQGGPEAGPEGHQEAA